MITTQLNWADDEWEKKTRLEDLEKEIEYAIKYKHFKDIPSEKEIREKGIEVGEMNGLLLRKIEQLYKYLWEMKKEMEDLKKELK